MAIRRMLSKKIIETDAFMEMPLSSQALYMHLVINADDDGFVSNPNTILKAVGCNVDDRRVLEAKRFVLTFESGVIVIKHWLIHNLIRHDRYTETTYLKEKSLLEKNTNKSYTFVKPLNEDVIPNGNQMATQVSIGKVSIGKYNKDFIVEQENEKSVPKPKKTQIPFKEIIDYLNLKVKGNYKNKTKKTRELITTRWNEGFKLDEFYKAIDNAYSFRMVNDNGDLTYLRPTTLFNGSMENRVNGSAFNFKPKKEETTSEEPNKYAKYGE